MSSRTSMALRVLVLLVTVLALAGASFAQVAKEGALKDPADAPLAAKVTSLGFRANEGGGGKLDLGYTGGNLGNTWTEGEWVFSYMARNMSITASAEGSKLLTYRLWAS